MTWRETRIAPRGDKALICMMPSRRNFSCPAVYG